MQGWSFLVKYPSNIHTHTHINIECERPNRFEFLFIKGDIGKGISSNFVH